ncbi:hypothetical protein ACJJTC_009490 [Scirpophaga incertulas]
MSIFFDFDVGPTGRRFRRAVDGDKSDISLMLSDESEKLFRDTDIQSLIELSTLPICLINEQKDVIGFMALGDFPPVPAVDPAHWETWIRNFYQKFCLSRSTLFIHHMCCADAAVEYFLEEALISVFENDLYIQQILLIVPPDCPQDILSKHPIVKKKYVYKHYARTDEENNSGSCLYTFARQELCPRLKIRRAVEEDNDDIVAILDKKCPKLKELYGAYYLSELVGRHPDSKREIVVVEHDERPVGVMCINTDINYKKLNATYELRPYHGLMKATPLEKEKAKRNNQLLQTFGNPIMLGKWSPFQNFVKHNTRKLSKKSHKKRKQEINPLKPAKVSFGLHCAHIPSQEYRRRQHFSEDSELVMHEALLQSHAIVSSITDILETDPFDYEIVNIDKALFTVPNVETCM